MDENEFDTIKKMQKKELIDSDLKEELNSLDFDIKAEAFFINFLKDYNIHYKFQDFFERGYSKDIKDIKMSNGAMSKTHYAHLTKLGFYDIFPEIIFHTSNNAGYTQEMVDHYKERKKQEAAAKDFFQPLENELFNYLLDTEKQEVDITSALGDREFLILLNKIWDIDQSLPYDMMAKVFKFIPFIHKISGNIVEYFDNGKINKIISLFLNFTIPFENDFEINFTIAPSKQVFILDDKPYTGRMNISTKLA